MYEFILQNYSKITLFLDVMPHTMITWVATSNLNYPKQI
jgi:hypothetical protein